uniref:KIAA2013 n=1 Tax=Apteryx owenii TaxID=8824 RepID=A0A8B9S8X1_APTOW
PPRRGGVPGSCRPLGAASPRRGPPLPSRPPPPPPPPSAPSSASTAQGSGSSGSSSSSGAGGTMEAASRPPGADSHRARPRSAGTRRLQEAARLPAPLPRTRPARRGRAAAAAPPPPPPGPGPGPGPGPPVRPYPRRGSSLPGLGGLRPRGVESLPEVVAHRSRPHLYLQRIRIANPTERVAAFEASAPASAPSLGGRFATSLEKAEERQFLLSSGRLLLPGSSKVVLMVVAAKKLVSRVQVAPKSHFDETMLSVVYTSEPIEASRLEETFSKLRESAKKEMLEVMQMGVEDLFQEHQQTWSDLFISGIEMRKITDLHTPSSETVNMTLYYVLSSMPAPLLDPLISGEDREKMEASLNYADHCFSGHATMHAENLWPAKLTSVPQILQLSDLWKLTLQKRGCKGLVAAGVHGLMQGMVLSFGGLQFTENHLQFQADPDVLHNSYSLRGIHYNKDLINLAVLLDAEGKPFLHVSVKFQDKPVRLYACEAGCMNEPVELTSEARGHTFPVMVTQPITPLLYISTDLIHLQDLRHTLHLKAILAHEEHMAKQYPGLPFLFWFSVASLITLFHLFLFKLIYNEYCGPGAKPLFRSKV